MELLLFILVSIGVIVVPGPNVLVVVSTSIAHGKRRGLQTVAGTSAAMAIQLIVAAIGTAWFVAALSSGFVWLKWAGVIYLCYLGISHFISAASKNEPRPATALGSFQRGFWVSLTNPKTILFFAAFLPQFISPGESFAAQIALLSAIFWLLAIGLDSGYALIAGKLAALPRNKDISKIRNYCSGVLYLGAGATLAASKYGR